MLFVLSPAKALDYETPATTDRATSPLFVEQAAELVAILRQKSPQEIAELMDLSDALAQLNVARYQAWQPQFGPHNSKPAVLAFNGDVYEGLDARSLTQDDLDWLQAHVCILSGLYGVLRPLDWMQPYRLEMGTRLVTPRGRNLYQFWGTRIADYLSERAAADDGIVVNLASEEYFKAVDLKALRARVITCVFEERRGSGYKVISFLAKRARGLMTRWAALHRVAEVEALKAFDSEGYRYAPEASGAERWVFRRDERP
ncbi:MAG: peroxide stress protein YaaA [Tepidimonas sp.]|uniref:peroxide stress protein YaaA n=1 Tax=Tepidimonas sp. TaxID=2002775 RepID=UPI00298F0674|nr:peroxide stress protein YaaA [Tepidimonas sp.]MDW8336654.1 peroxide stress protein YaaA [Tepidimonas sp.]